MNPDNLDFSSYNLSAQEYEDYDNDNTNPVQLFGAQAQKAMQRKYAQARKMRNAMLQFNNSVTQAANAVEEFGESVSSPTQRKITKAERAQIRATFVDSLKKLCNKHSLEELLTHSDPLVRELTVAIWRVVNRDSTTKQAPTVVCGEEEVSATTTTTVSTPASTQS